MTTQTRSRKALLSILLGACLWTIVEGVSLLALHLASGGYGSVLRAREQAAGVGGETASRLMDLAQPAPGGPSREVLHPYLGFVFNPEINEAEERRARGELEITDLGFFRPPGPPQPRPADALRIGVVGGSAAFLFAFTGEDRLIAELQASAPFKGRELVVDSFALGGHKEPQQLLTLSYLLSLGESFDIVINLDGFNEVVLPATENVPNGVFSVYPRGWRRRVEGLSDLESLRRLGTLEVLRERRHRLAELFSKRPLSASPTWNLLWWAQERRLLREIGGVEAELESSTAESATYEATGPKEALRDEEELYRHLAEVWMRSSLQLHHLCRANGIAYFHFLQPNQYVPGSKRLTAAERENAYLEDHPYRRAVERGYPFLQEAGETLAREGVRFADLTQAFVPFPEESLYFDTCCHFNQRGNEILAERIAEVILEGPDVEP